MIKCLSNKFGYTIGQNKKKLPEETQPTLLSYRDAGFLIWCLGDWDFGFQ
jgi:hypothetical protein